MWIKDIKLMKMMMTSIQVRIMIFLFQKQTEIQPYVAKKILILKVGCT